MFNRPSLLFLLMFSSFSASSQDFDRFTTLHSHGSIPRDIVTPTSEKIAAKKGSQKGNLSAGEEKIFLERIHYQVDELLKSGMVVYGDSVTRYVQNVASRLLSSEPQLLSELRFYTYKSNIANAFSTDQGIIFVTTGLISQLSTESQLAYVLAHEIAHYQLKHVVQSFQFENSPRNQTISKLSIYSKEKELEADKTAMKLYNEAGYSRNDLDVTFDVLMYSYLPFDEVEVPKTYYNDSLVYIPVSAFPTKTFPIKAKEDYNDATSSHPNIKKRKEAVDKATSEFSNWGEASFLLSREEFQNVRNIARFEGVRADLLEGDFTSALYNIFLLEQDYPDSYYLRKMKALAWLGFAQFKDAGKSGFPTTYKEGQIAAYYNFLHGLSSQQVMTLALREVYDFHKKFPDNAEAQDIYEFLLKNFAQSKKFKLNSYSSRTFVQASAPGKDTLKPVLTEEALQPVSKYDKIRSGREENPDKHATVFDSTQFHLYAISDIVKDSLFQERFEYWKNFKDAEEEKFDITNTILFAPEVEYYEKRRIAYAKSQLLSEKLAVVTKELAEESGGDLLVLDDNSLSINGTNEFNERSILVSNLWQSVNYEDIAFYPVNKVELGQIRNAENKQSAMFVHVKRTYRPQFSPTVFLVALSGIGVAWLLFDYIPYKIISGNSVRLDVISFDLETGLPLAVHGSSYTEKLTPVSYGAHIYRLFHKEKNF